MTRPTHATTTPPGVGMFLNVEERTSSREAISLRLRAIARWHAHADAGRCTRANAVEAEAVLREAIARIERGEQ